VTFAAVLLGIVGTFILGVGLMATSGDPRWLFLSLPFTALLVAVGRYAPTGYRLAADGVHVERRAGARVIPYRTIRAVDREPRPLHGFTVLACRGVFGRFGRFWNARLGLYRLDVTDARSVVWLTTDRGLVGLSPARPDEFVEALRRRLGGAG